MQDKTDFRLLIILPSGEKAGKSYRCAGGLLTDNQT